VVGLRDTKKRGRVLGFWSDEDDEPLRRIFASFDTRRAGGRPRRCSISTRGQCYPQGDGEICSLTANHRPRLPVAALSSPSWGAVFAKAGRKPAKDSGIPTSDRVGLPDHRWMMPSASV